MKNYFKRLKNHPGVGPAGFMTVLTFAAASQNKSLHSIEAVLIVGACISSLFWIAVLISNFKRK